MKEIIEKAIVLLDKKFNLPKTGFLAGGALANTINKLKWGGQCIINDIDIFYVDEIKEYDKNEHYKKSIPASYTTKKLVTEYKIDTYQDRLFISKIDKGDDYITIKSSEREGIFNQIKFDTNKLDYHLFLETFDINCTQVGYDLENNKAYWSNDFEEYLNTKELKVVLPNTPSHTALRILKKRDELNAKLNVKNELQFLGFSNLEKIKGRKKTQFGMKYKPIYDKYKDELLEYFYLESQIGTRTKRVIDSLTGNSIYGEEKFQLFKLLPKEWEFGIDEKYTNLIIGNITLEEYHFYWRKIRPDSNKKLIWKHLQQFYKKESYLDGFPIERANELEDKFIYIKELIKKYPSLLKWLENKNLIEQMKYIKILKEVCDENEGYYDILSHHPKIILFENKHDLKEKMQIFKIRYRKKIYADKKKNNIAIYDLFI